jgi:intracellular multiplication protein IcmJ
MKNMLPITLTARRGNLKKFMARRANEKFQAIKKQIVIRDEYTCRYCGFHAQEFMEIVNIDHNYDNNKMSNMATACSFCTQCLFLDAVGTLPRTGGVVVFIPELSQADLNNFCRVLFCSMDKETIYKNKLHSVYMSLKERTKDVEKSFGPDTSNPKIFGQSLIDSQLTAEQLNHDALQHLRVLPNRKDFKKEIDYWKKTVFANVPL